MNNSKHVNSLSTQGVVPYNTLVGKSIEKLRTQAGLTQADLSAALELGQSAYSKLESGQTAMTLAQLRLIASKLKCEPHEILKSADALALQLESSGVEVPAKKDENKAALLIGLGLLLALMSKS